MAAERASDETEARVPRPETRPQGVGLGWLPDLAALIAGAAGAIAFEDAARWLCGVGGFAALTSLGARLSRGDHGDDRSEEARSGAAVLDAVASLPALLLLAGIVAASRSGGSGRAPFGSSPSAPYAPSAIRIADAPPAASDCLASEAAKAYLEALYRHLEATWQARDASDESGFVVLGFLLDAQGEVRLSRVIDRSSDAYRESGMATLSQAAPFGPLTGELDCLEAIELRATFDRASLR